MAAEPTTGPPDFIGVGTQRSGTTWWFQTLLGHPQIRPPRGRRKELHFFDRFCAQELQAADIAAYHELYQVERSFRMAKSDLAARPMFHRIRDSIEAHLTVVFAALAVSREAQDRTGVSIKKIVQTLRPLRSATISLGRQQITARPRIPDAAQAILTNLNQGGH